MSRTESVKAKLLNLYRILDEQTDEDHGLTIPEIIDALEARGISAERKGIYSDLQALREAGTDIVLRKVGGRCEYFIAGRTFELAELKLLVDAVACSRFITPKKSRELIGKLESLTSVYQASQLNRQIFVADRIKADNEEIYYTVDRLQSAILEDRQVSFLYFDYGVNKKKVLRRGGERYVVSPLSLCWNNENYYLIAYYERYQSLSHFRVDRMMDLSRTEQRRAHIDAARLNAADYCKKLFGMFAGEETPVKIQFDNSLINVVLDRFGQEVYLRPVDEGHFCVTAKVVPSPSFFGWLFGFAGKAVLLYPPSVIDQYRQMLQTAAEPLLQKGAES